MAQTSTVTGRGRTGNAGRTDGFDPWTSAIEDALTALGSTANGLTQSTALERLAGEAGTRRGILDSPAVRLLLRQFASPIVVLLVVATCIAIALGDVIDGVIILSIIVASGVLGFRQDERFSMDGSTRRCLLVSVTDTSRTKGVQ